MDDWPYYQDRIERLARNLGSADYQIKRLIEIGDEMASLIVSASDEHDPLAAERGHKVGELAIAWLVSHPWLSTVIAGATSPEQLDQSVGGIEWKLTAEEVAQVEQI